MLLNKYKQGLIDKQYFNDHAFRIIPKVFPYIYTGIEFEYQKKDIKMWSTN